MHAHNLKGRPLPNKHVPPQQESLVMLFPVWCDVLNSMSRPSVTWINGFTLRPLLKVTWTLSDHTLHNTA